MVSGSILGKASRRIEPSENSPSRITRIISRLAATELRVNHAMMPPWLLVSTIVIVLPSDLHNHRTGLGWDRRHRRPDQVATEGV